MPNMTGRPGCRTMEMNGGSSAPYLACTLCVPLFCTLFNRMEREELLDYQGRAGIISIVRWNLRPVIFGVEICYTPIWGTFAKLPTTFPWHTCKELRKIHRQAFAGRAVTEIDGVPKWEVLESVFKCKFPSLNFVKEFRRFLG